MCVGVNYSFHSIGCIMESSLVCWSESRGLTSTEFIVTRLFIKLFGSCVLVVREAGGCGGFPENQPHFEREPL